MFEKKLIKLVILDWQKNVSNKLVKLKCRNRYGPKKSFKYICVTRNPYDGVKKCSK